METNSILKSSGHSITVFYKGDRFLGRYTDGDRIIRISGDDMTLLEDWYRSGVQFRRKNILKNTLLCQVGDVGGFLTQCYPFDSLFGWMLIFKSLELDGLKD